VSNKFRQVFMKEIVKYLSKNKARVLPVVILLFLAIATLLTLTLTRSKQELRSKAVADTGQLTFANLTPTSVTPGSTFTISINMANSGTNNIVGADILVCFDRNKLNLQGLTQNTTTGNPYKTYAPVTSAGAFDTAKVITNANTVNTVCGSGTTAGTGVVEFGIVSFDWTGNALTTPTTSLTNVSTLSFQVKTGTSGTAVISFVNNGITSTTDSNIVIIPSGGGDPEDILAAPGYTNSTATVTITGTAATPSPTPRSTPGASVTPRPTPTATPGTCTVRNCQDYGGLITGKIDIQDIAPMVGRFNITSTDPNYSTIYDLNCDNKINVLGDIAAQAGHWNLACP
jgi:hypothetical protein